MAAKRKAGRAEGVAVEGLPLAQDGHQQIDGDPSGWTGVFADDDMAAGATPPPMVQVEHLDLACLVPSPNNPRVFDGDDAKNHGLVELSRSIAAVGVLEPILVRRIDRPGAYEIVAGERRWRAARLAGLATAPCLVRDLDDRTALELTVTENLQREDLSPLEESRGVQSLLDGGWDAATIADHLGKPVGWVVRRARISKLSPSWRLALKNPKLDVCTWPATALELVARLDPDAQEALAKQNRWILERGVDSVETLARHLADWTRQVAKARWSPNDAELLPIAGACSACPKRSSVNPGLFDEDDETKGGGVNDRCLDATCWDKKMAAWMARREAELAAKHGSVLIADHRFADERRKDAVDTYGLRPCKKNDPKAVPLLHVTGHDAGKLEWVLPPGTKGGGSAGKSGAKAKGADGKPAKAPLAERREALDRRRKVRALELIREAIGEAKTPPFPDCVSLAIVFGTNSNATKWGRCEDMRTMRDRLVAGQVEPAAKLLAKASSHGEAYDLVTAATAEDRAELLWGQVFPVVVACLQVLDGKDAAERWPLAEAACRILFGDAKAADWLETAAAEIPEPKSWAAEAAAEKAGKPAPAGA